MIWACVTFSWHWFITEVKVKLNSVHCHRDQSHPVIYHIPNIQGCGHDSQNPDYLHCNVLSSRIHYLPLPRTGPVLNGALTRFIFLLSYRNVRFIILCPTRRGNERRLLVLAAPPSILLCVPLLFHPHLSSLAPAILMTPRQEAELAWGTWVIFTLSLCQFVLFVAAFHWNFGTYKNP